MALDKFKDPYVNIRFVCFEDGKLDITLYVQYLPTNFIFFYINFNIGCDLRVNPHHQYLNLTLVSCFKT